MLESDTMSTQGDVMHEERNTRTHSEEEVVADWVTNLVT